jgi:ABC-2 type transport system ATP-binding protein
MTTATIGVSAIDIRGLTKRFGNVQALRGLDLTVPPGSVFGFLGPNAAGKTTTLSILAGLSHPSAGSARICGLDVVADGMAVRRQIGFLRQDPRFYRWMTGRETLQFVGRFFDLTPREIDQRAAELLDLVDLASAADRTMGGYSGGMRQRLGIAQALMGKPRVLLLDEPCASLDPAGRVEVIGIMERLRGSTTVFYSTHILQDVERVADEVAIIRAGRCVLQSPVADLLAGDRDSLVVEVKGDPATLAEELRRQTYVRAVARDADGTDGHHLLRVSVDDLAVAQRAVPALVVAHDLLLLRCQPERRSLEEVFLALTGGESGDR